MSPPKLTAQIMGLERPHPSLWKYYILCAIFTGPGIVFSLPYLYFRYHTLRYRFDAEGIHMKVGILFRSEINLTYARIQDIHLRSNLIQRWLGLANVQIQTASGSSGAEMVIEGFREYESIRDFLYSNMRGFQDPPKATATSEAARVPGVSATGSPATSELLSVLAGIRDELRQTRELLDSEMKNSPAKTSETPPSSHA